MIIITWRHKITILVAVLQTEVKDTIDKSKDTTHKYKNIQKNHDNMKFRKFYPFLTIFVLPLVTLDIEIGYILTFASTNDDGFRPILVRKQ